MSSGQPGIPTKMFPHFQFMATPARLPTPVGTGIFVALPNTETGTTLGYTLTVKPNYCNTTQGEGSGQSHPAILGFHSSSLRSSEPSAAYNASITESAIELPASVRATEESHTSSSPHPSQPSSPAPGDISFDSLPDSPCSTRATQGSSTPSSPYPNEPLSPPPEDFFFGSQPGSPFSTRVTEESRTSPSPHPDEPSSSALGGISFDSPSKSPVPVTAPEKKQIENESDESVQHQSDTEEPSAEADNEICEIMRNKLGDVQYNALLLDIKAPGNEHAICRLAGTYRVHNSVMSRLVRKVTGTAPQKHVKLTPEQRQKLQRMFEQCRPGVQNLTDKEMGREVGLSKQAIRRRRVKQGVKKQDIRRPNYRLTTTERNALMADISDMYSDESETSSAQIVRKYLISPATFSSYAAKVRTSLGIPEWQNTHRHKNKHDPSLE